MRLFHYVKLLFRRMFSVYHVVLMKRFAGTPIKSVDNNCPVDIRKVNEEMVSDTIAFESVRYEAIYRRMLKENQSGYFGYLDGCCIYRSWVKLIDQLDFYGICQVPLERASALFHYDFCALEARGNGIHTEDIRRRCEEFFDYDCYSTIAPQNSSSMIGYVKNGFLQYKDVCVGYLLFIPFRVIKDIEKAN